MVATKASPGSRSGMVLVMVLILAAVLAVSALAVLRVNSDDVGRLQIQMARLQASYLARGGLNLALLKARALPQPLYNAVSLRVGRNPYYPHGNPNAYATLGSNVGPQSCSGISPTDPNALIFAGPAFFTGVPGTPPQNRTNVDTVPGAGSNNAINGDYDGDGTPEKLVEEYVAKFQADLCDANVVANMGRGANQLKPQTSIQVPDVASNPFLGIPDPPVFVRGSFLVTDIATYGTKGAENATDEVVRIQVLTRLVTSYSGKQYTNNLSEFTFHKITRE